MKKTDSESIISELKIAVIPWRKLIIAIDGVDDAGKSTFGRLLSWKLGMPLIETDLFLNPELGRFCYRLPDLAKVVAARHTLKRPIILEGIFILRLLEQLQASCDYLIYVDRAGNPGSIEWADNFKEYKSAYAPESKANWVLSWDDASS